jgi:23S rRNA pseudouridine1911/1915/1917 synthase
MMISERALEILWEDEWLLAVDKPAGLVVHPTYRNASGTLLDALRTRDSSGRFFLLGRLDKLTSGVVLLGKDRETYAAMQRSWSQAEKDYLAVVHGVVEPDCGQIDLPHGADPADRRRRIVRPDGAASVTRFERLASDGKCSLLRCHPLSGRRHQIRLHLAARGWPVVGDAVYGRAMGGFPRHALHAWQLRFAHPVTGASIRIEARVPPDIVALYPNSDTVVARCISRSARPPRSRSTSS